MPSARTALAYLAWLFVAMVVVQVFLAGVGLFGAGNLDGHREFGYFVASFPLLILLACWPARAGRRLAWLSAALLLAAQVQTALPWFREGLPIVAALHPVNALAIFWLGLVIARRARALERAPDAARPKAEPARAG